MKRKLAAIIVTASIWSFAGIACGVPLLIGNFGANIPFGPFSPSQTITVVVDVTNTSPDHAITICEGVCLGDAYTYSLGGWVGSPSGYLFNFGNGSSLPGIWNGQIAGVLAPGQTKEFVFGMYTPEAAAAEGFYGFFDQLQIFAATADRPLLDAPSFYGNWQVVATALEPATFALIGVGLAGIGFSRRKVKTAE